MNYGFVKVAAAVPRVKIADCNFNAKQLESLIAVADGKVRPFTKTRMCLDFEI